MKYFISLLIAGFLLSGCVSSKVPLTGREQVMLVSEPQEKKLGSENYQKFLSQANLSKNQKDIAMVNRIGQKIASIANRDDYNWEFKLVEDKQLNAFCLPGGKVVVYTGILEIAQNEDQLATVMSHEVAHALARHGAERMSHSMISNGIYNIGAIILNSQAPQYSSIFNQAYGIGTNLGVMLPYSREHEYEADEIGIHLMKKAGYNVREAINFWQNMQKNSKTSTPEFLSTHPHSSNRIKRIKEIIGKIQN
jgi:predicted Zn-dependent protease